MKEATLRKRQIVYRQLRSGGKAVETDKESKSFFDYYPGKIYGLKFKFLSILCDASFGQSPHICETSTNP
jgi:hypothetical protein